MAKSKKSSSKPKQAKPSMRDLASTSSANAKKSRRIKKARGKLASPFRKIKLPNNKFGRFARRLVPGFFRGAWGEIRQTTWPNRKDTIRLTIAVFVFSTIFAVIIAFLDFVLDKIFKNLIIK